MLASIPAKTAVGRVFFILAGLGLSWSVYIGVYIISAEPLSSYAPETVHAPLAREAAELFNSQNPDKKLDWLDTEKLVQGAIQEDKGYHPGPSGRWFYHFFDPVYKRGLQIGAFEFPASKNWAHNSLLQSASTGGAHTWEDALWHWQQGNKQQALTDLGHILHLLQDLTVPAHTRNDPHPPQWAGFFIGDANTSPYEKWTAEKVGGEPFPIAEKLIKNRQRVPRFSNLDQLFETTAEFTNQHFFSEDTLNTGKYKRPTVVDIVPIDGRTALSWGRVDNRAIPLYFLSREEFNNIVKTTDYDRVLSAYWQILSEKAVVQGAALLELFFRQVKEREIKKRPSRFYDLPRLALERLQGFLSSLPPGSQQAGITQFAASVVPVVPSQTSPAVRGQTPHQGRILANQPPDNKQLTFQTTLLAPSNSSPSLKQGEDSPNQQHSSGQPGTAYFEPSGGSGRPSSIRQTAVFPAGQGSGQTEKQAERQNQPSQQEQEKEDEQIDETEQKQEKLSQSEQEEPDKDQNQEQTAQNGSEQEKEQSGDSSPPSADQNDVSEVDQGKQQENQGQASQAEQNKDEPSGQDQQDDQSEQNQQPQPNEQAVQDSQPDSEQPGGQDEDSNQANAEPEQSEATSEPEPAPEPDTEPKPEPEPAPALPPEPQNQPPPASPYQGLVFINEVAWMGTSASPQDEWLELYNADTRPALLKGWTLEAEDGRPRVHFNEGDVMPAHSYFLLERTDNETVANVKADKLYTGALQNSGETLILKDQDDLVVDKVPEGSWLAGSNTSKRSMEKRFPTAPSGNPQSWQDYQGDGLDENCQAMAQDAQGNPILGTPKAANSKKQQAQLHQSGPTLIPATTTITSAVTWNPCQSPYLLQFDSSGNHPTIAPGGTLQLLPGVKIMFEPADPITQFGGFPSPVYTGLEVQGKLTVLGSSNPAPVIFEYPSDLTWNQSTNGSLEMLKLKPGAQVSITGAQFNGNFAGAQAYETVTLINNQAASVQISDTLFQNAYIGLRADGEKGALSNIGGLVQDSHFQNLYFPAFLRSSYMEFQNNRGLGNTLPGLVYVNRNNISSIFEKDLSWYKNASSLPYILEVNARDFIQLAAGVTLTIKPGVTILSAGADPSIEALAGAKIIAAGTQAEPVVFSSSADNPQPGDWQGIKLTGAQGEFSYVRFEYGGKDSGSFPPTDEAMLMLTDGAQAILKNTVFDNGAEHGIVVKNSQLSLKDAQIKNQAQHGLLMDNSDSRSVEIIASEFAGNSRQGIQAAAGSAGKLVVKNSQFIGSGSFFGIKTEGSSTELSIENSSFQDFRAPLLTNSKVSALNLNIAGGGLEGIQVSGGLPPGESAQWRSAGLPYLFSGTLQINNSSTLEILPGTVIKPTSISAAIEVLAGGELGFKGTTSSPVIVTSVWDDSAGGDIFGNGTSTMPSTGDWKQVLYRSGSTGTLQHTQLRYGGQGGAPVLQAEPGANVTSTNLIITNSVGPKCQPASLCP